jgi:surfeit locus 1 family protein
VQQSRSPLVLKPAGIAATLAVFIVVALCFRLGFWQLDRREQRLAYNAALSGRGAEPVVLDPELLRDTTGLAYRRATLEGRWDNTRSIVLPGRSHRGAPGVHLLTPLRLDGAGFAVLVNRGWVPAADGATIDFEYFVADSAITATGVLLPFPTADDSRGGTPRPAAQPGMAEFRRVWFAVDPGELRAQFPYRLADVQLQILAERDPTTAPIPAAAPALDAGPHLGYAIQWFSFGLIALIGWGAIVLRGAGGSSYGPLASGPPREASAD